MESCAIMGKKAGKIWISTRTFKIFWLQILPSLEDFSKKMFENAAENLFNFSTSFWLNNWCVV